MNIATIKLTVFFEDPFWVGVFERVEGGQLSVAKFIFGEEPKDYEVYEFVLRHYYGLKFSPSVAVEEKKGEPNAKRMKREVKKQLYKRGVGTKAQQALQLQREQNKTERKIKTRTQKDAEKELKFALRKEKKKEKHRGK